jgi:cyclophilin family peptidyl-prolyl cis-trans isomerase
MCALSHRHARLLPAVLGAACAALIAGCGGSSSASTSSASPSGAASTPTPTASAVAPAVSAASTPCNSASFGAALQPKDAPADVHKYAAAPGMQIDAAKLYLATIKTGKGDIVICLQPKIAPKTVNNFVVLARNHFYDGLTFHRVVAGFVIQGGDPSGNGTGGPGYQFADEPVQGEYTPGCMAMANAGPNTNGSQFFICIADDTTLPKNYNLFGAVSKGLDVATHVAQGDKMESVTVQEQS